MNTVGPASSHKSSAKRTTIVCVSVRFAVRESIPILIPHPLSTPPIPPHLPIPIPLRLCSFYPALPSPSTLHPPSRTRSASEEGSALMFPSCRPGREPCRRVSRFIIQPRATVSILFTEAMKPSSPFHRVACQPHRRALSATPVHGAVALSPVLKPSSRMERSCR